MTDNNNRYFTLLTDKGKFKIAKAAADKGEVKFSHFAIGDGGGQEVNPTPNQTALVHEVWRAQLDSVEIDPKNPAAVIINAIIPHNVGGFWMREFGLFDVDGDMLAVVKPAPYYKATSAEGQLEDVFYEFQLVIGEQAQVVVLVDPSILWATREYVETRRIPAWQFMNTPWLPVKALDITTPPTSNNQGDTYVIPAASKGAWKEKTGQLAEWNGKAWNFIQTRDGHGIGLPDGSIYIKINGVYTLSTDLLDKRYAKFPEPPATTFYVVGPSGSDKNTGLKPTPADGFATIQGAVDAVSKYMTMLPITIIVSPGTYDSVVIPVSHIPAWTFIGNKDNPELVKIVAKDERNKSTCFNIGTASNVTISGFSLLGFTGCVSTNGGFGNVYDSNVQLCKSKGNAFEAYGGSIFVGGSVNVKGGFDYVFFVADKGTLSVGFRDNYGRTPVKITFDNVSSVAVFFARTCATLSIAMPVVSFEGEPTATSFICTENATLNTWGLGTDDLPGKYKGYTMNGGRAG